MQSVEEAFRMLAIGDPRMVAAMADREAGGEQPPPLDERTESLLRLAALIAVDAPASSYRAAVACAERAGVRLEELFAVLIAIVDEVGSARVLSAAPRIALAAGYDVEADLEQSHSER
jgi:hypothetical protein